MNKNLQSYLKGEGKTAESGFQNAKVKELSEKIGKKPGNLQFFMRTGVGSGPKVIA